MTGTRDLSSHYRECLPVLSAIAGDLKREFERVLDNVRRVDKISTRVKSISRFLDKAQRTDASGQLRYSFPLQEIQDQIGARVVVFYLSDVGRVGDLVLKEFRYIEDQEVEQPSVESFGYEARHMICLIPPEIVARHEPPIDVFELQVCTLFQHAWAQANHDLGYQPHYTSLTGEERKRLAWAAAQAWGADQIFQELFNRN